MTAFGLPLSQLIHENLSVVMNFAFARGPLESLMKRFEGDWKYLHKALFDVSEGRAQRACLELAMFIRLLDDEEGLSVDLKGDKIDFGRLVEPDGTEGHLSLRDVSNKIIHASLLRWDFSHPDAPVLVCESKQPKLWRRAEVNLVPLAAFCGQLMG